MDYYIQLCPDYVRCITNEINTKKTPKMWEVVEEKDLFGFVHYMELFSKVNPDLFLLCFLDRRFSYQLTEKGLIEASWWQKYYKMSKEIENLYGKRYDVFTPLEEWKRLINPKNGFTVV